MSSPPNHGDNTVGFLKPMIHGSTCRIRFCWIRQNMKMHMSDRVSPPKAYDTRSDMSYTMVSNGVLGGDTRSDIPIFCHIQHVVRDKSDRVS